MITSKITQRKKPQRYTTEDDEDDGGDAGAAGSSTPGMCLVLIVPDEDEIDPNDMRRILDTRASIIGRLRALNLVVEMQQTEEYIFLKIFAPLPMQKYEAEEQGIRIRLKAEYGGAMCTFSDVLDQKEAFEKSVDDFDLFSSAKQLTIIDAVATSVPYSDRNGDMVEPIEFERLKEDPDSGVAAYFPLHHDRFQMILKREWAFNFTAPQCLEKVREYFGDEIGLFFTWLGYYITMLWLPAIWGTAMFIYQCMYGAESPFMLSLCVANIIWGVLFSKLWKSLQKCRSYQWDTLNFEDEEKKVGQWDAFKEHPLTLKNEHVDEVTAEIVEYWYDDGTYFPPTGRKRTQMFNKVVIFVFDLIIVLLIQACWKVVALPMMSEGNVVAGAVVMGILDFGIKRIADIACFGMREIGMEEGLLEIMVNAENWPTRTEYADAEIWSTFYVKVVVQYFAFFYVGFLVNYAPLFPGQHCPGWQCLPVLEIMLLTEVILICVYTLFELVALPNIVRFLEDLQDARRAAGIKVPPKSSMEQQFKKQEPPHVVDLYRDLIYDHLGILMLFGAASPEIGICILLFAMCYLRIAAHIFLNLRQRDLPHGAQDIGAYETVIDCLQMMAMVTNALVAGSTSFAFYFYDPQMSSTDVLWATIIFEHVLILIKICVFNIIPDEPAEAKFEYIYQREMKSKQLKKWDIKEHASFTT